jgi:hypothetical protein
MIGNGNLAHIEIETEDQLLVIEIEEIMIGADVAHLIVIVTKIIKIVLMSVIVRFLYVCGSGALFFKIDFNGLLSPVSVTLGCNGVVISYKEGAEYTPEYECVV